jgi:hypothetical protein
MSGQVLLATRIMWEKSVCQRSLRRCVQGGSGHVMVPLLLACEGFLALLRHSLARIESTCWRLGLNKATFSASSSKSRLLKIGCLSVGHWLDHSFSSRDKNVSSGQAIASKTRGCSPSNLLVAAPRQEAGASHDGNDSLRYPRLLVVVSSHAASGVRPHAASGVRPRLTLSNFVHDRERTSQCPQGCK